jgi:hypothetical protein
MTEYFIFSNSLVRRDFLKGRIIVFGGLGLNFLLFLTALLIGLLPDSGDAREMGCLGQDGCVCYCCTPNRTLETTEAFSPCSCPCPGLEKSSSFDQDILTAPIVLAWNLEAIDYIDSPNPVTRFFFGRSPQKPPPFLL